MCFCQFSGYSDYDYGGTCSGACGNSGAPCSNDAGCHGSSGGGGCSSGYYWCAAALSCLAIGIACMGGCFTAGTKIKRRKDDESFEDVNIEDIKVDDIVKSYDTKNKEIVNKKVIETFVHENDPNGLILNDIIKTTTNHHFYSDGKWVSGENLKIGDKILHIDDKEYIIESKELSNYSSTVYNFEVEGTHNYFAEGLLAHNRRGGSRKGGYGSPNWAPKDGTKTPVTPGGRTGRRVGGPVRPRPSYQTGGRTSGGCPSGDWKIDPYGYEYCAGDSYAVGGQIDSGGIYSCSCFGNHCSGGCTNAGASCGGRSGGSCYGGGSACFQEGTQIETPDGSKSIEAIEVGDVVKSYDTKNKKIVDKKVMETFVHPDNSDGLLLNNKIKTTTNHHFYTSENKWIAAEDLKIGDKILYVDGLHYTIESIEPLNYSSTVYNFEVDGTHNYFAEGLLAHNRRSKRRSGKRRITRGRGGR